MNESFFSGAFTNSASSSTEQTRLTPEMIDEMVKIISHIPPCAIKEWMRKQGCNPDYGWVLAVPEHFKQEYGLFPPPYLKFHKMGPSAYLLNTAINRIEFVERIEIKENVDG